MIDLINKVDNFENDEIQKLKIKYSSLIKTFNNVSSTSYLLYIIDVSIDYINHKHKKATKEWKSWAVLIVKILFENNKIKYVEEITKIIDEFFDYKKKEYDAYIENLGSYSSDFYRDYYFILNHTKKY